MIGHVIREWLPRGELLNYLDAILRVYNRHGRRDNLYKARIKILVRDLTPAAFAEQVEEEFAYLEGGPATIPDAEFARMEAFFAPPRLRSRCPRRCSRRRAARAGRRQQAVRELGPAQHVRRTRCRATRPSCCR